MPSEGFKFTGSPGVIVPPYGWILGEIIKATSKSVTKTDEAANQDLAALRIESERQELEMRIRESQARVLQEIAIAKRIETADEVEMEEFYDNSAEGHVGVKMDGKSPSIGAGGSGRRVNKRIFRFRGGTGVAKESTPNP